MNMEPSDWNYSFLLHTCNLGSETKVIINPFTRQQFEVPVDLGLTGPELDAVRQTLNDSEIKLLEVTEEEGWATYGNKYATFKCFDLDGASRIDSIHTELKVVELTDQVLQMYWDLASKGNLALMSDGRQFVRFAGHRPDEKMLARWPDAEELHSITDLRNWLENQIQGIPDRQQKQDDDDGKVYFVE